jgi:protein phosphatase
MTDQGKVRESNQDHFLIAKLVKSLQIQQSSLASPQSRRCRDEGHLFVVADGMGGHAGGEQASALAVTSVQNFFLDAFKWFATLQGDDENLVVSEFQAALGHAHARVLHEGEKHPELHAMGTTLTMAYSLNDRLLVAHVGDSRCYLVRGPDLFRVTHDHTLAEELVRRGSLSAERASHHAWRHMVTNAIGGESQELKVEVHRISLVAGDVLLLCSDGLTNMVPDPDIARIIREEDDVERCTRKLVSAANDAGGRDNITVIIARFEPDTRKPEVQAKGI